MAAVLSEIIEIVLRHVQNPLDLIACSVVSQAWYSAYQNAQTSSLDLTISRRRLTEKHVYGLVQWIQAQQARGNFCQLTALTIGFDGYQDDSNEQYFYYGAVLMLAGTWPLQDVEVIGAFDFEMALKLLPGSVKQLKLCPSATCFPDIVHLASSNKFTTLQTLVVFPFGDDPTY